MLTLVISRASFPAHLESETDATGRQPRVSESILCAIVSNRKREPPVGLKFITRLVSKHRKHLVIRFRQ